MFSYPDAARYRLGVNYQQLPTNHPLSPVYSPFERDGFATITPNYGPDPNYVRSSLRPLTYGPADIAHDEWVGKVTAWTSEISDVDFAQPRALWEKWGRDGKGEQEVFVGNLCASLKGAIPRVQKETVKMFARVDEKLAGMLERKLEGLL
jgi:catalase